jgi:VanZ family protein
LPARAGFALLIVVAGILFASLYPFDFAPRGDLRAAMTYLLSTWRVWDGGDDLLANVLAYMPFGALAVLSVSPRVPGVVRVLLASVGGALLSACIELAQFSDAGRVTSMGDVYANTIGAASGALLAAVAARLRGPVMDALRAQPDATVVLIAWLGWRLYPFVPGTDLAGVWRALNRALAAPIPPLDDLARPIAVWLLVAAIVAALSGSGRRWLAAFALLGGCEELGRVVVSGDPPGLADIAGAGIAGALWTVPVPGRRWRFGLAALAMAALIAALRLEPYVFSATPRSFGWVPFASFVRGYTGIAMQNAFEKTALYSGLIWLLWLAGVPLPIGTGVTALLLFATSFAQTWLPGRSAEITDAALALLIGVAFGQLRSVAARPEARDEPGEAVA